MLQWNRVEHSRAERNVTFHWVCHNETEFNIHFLTKKLLICVLSARIGPIYFIHMAKDLTNMKTIT